MPAKCGIPAYLNPGQNPGRCRIAATRTCVNCGQTSCWQHARMPCPQGIRTKYGVTQHLTTDQKQLLQQPFKLKLQSLCLSARNSSDPSNRAVVITVTVLTPSANNNTLALHPGGLQPALDGHGWEPDEELTAWLANMLGDQVPIQETWHSKRDCIPFIREAILARPKERPELPQRPNWDNNIPKRFDTFQKNEQRTGRGGQL